MHVRKTTWLRKSCCIYTGQMRCRVHRPSALQRIWQPVELWLKRAREHPEVSEKAARCADGLAELEVQGDKDLKVRFYNIEDALDEKSWIAGIISETFGRKVMPHGLACHMLQCASLTEHSSNDIIFQISNDRAERTTA